MTDDPTRGGTLTLDLARCTGWAYGPAGARPQAFGAWDLGPATLGHGVVLAGLADHLGFLKAGDVVHPLDAAGKHRDAPGLAGSFGQEQVDDLLGRHTAARAVPDRRQKTCR
jgi:hypothetical protein